MLRLWLPESYPGQVAEADPPRGMTQAMLLALGESIALFRQCAARNHQRRALRELDSRLLADIGVSREAAAKEASRWL
jgi:uncharacterized protein YjiS (DUF1127 family)